MKHAFLSLGVASVAFALACEGSNQRQEPAQAARLHDACSNDAFCAPSSLLCHVALGCVQCITNVDCDSGTMCSSEGVCIASQACTTESDCGGDFCVNGICNECLNDSHCDSSDQTCQQGVCRVLNQPIVVPGVGASTTGTTSGTASGTTTGETTGPDANGGTAATGTTTGTTTEAGGSGGGTTVVPGGGTTSSAGGAGSGTPTGSTSSGGTTTTAGASSGGVTGGEPVLPTVPAGAQTFTFSLSDLHGECWEGTTNPYSTTVAVEEVRLSILPVKSGDVNFDFCIYRVSMLTATDIVDLTWGQDGWMAADYGSNATVGVVGPWFAFNDDAGSSITGGDGTGFEGRIANGDPVCVSGTAVEVQDDDFATYWGAAVAFHPNGPDGEGLGYVPGDYGVDTIRIVIAGSDVPTDHLRFALYAPTGVQYCGDVF